MTDRVTLSIPVAIPGLVALQRLVIRKALTAMFRERHEATVAFFAPV